MTGSFVLPFRQVMYAPYPTTHIDVDINTVKQMPPCHEHIYNQRRYMRSELTAFWRATSDEEMAQDTVIHTDESFTPDLCVLSYLLIYQISMLGNTLKWAYMKTSKSHQRSIKYIYLHIYAAMSLLPVASNE